MTALDSPLSEIVRSLARQRRTGTLKVSEGAGAEWDEKQRRSALRNYETAVKAIESGEPEEARSTMEKSLAAAARYWERTASDELKAPVAWIDSDR